MSLQSFTEAYLTCALWSSMDESEPNGGYPLDTNYDIGDIHPESLAIMKEDCRIFYEAYSHLLRENSDDLAGHDFWPARNGHGAGFWDGNWPKHGDELTEASKRFGECDLCIGDDNMLHVFPMTMGVRQ